MNEKIVYYGGLRLNDLLKQTQYGTRIKVISAKTGRTLIQSVSNGDKNHDYYWGIEIHGIHTEMKVAPSKDYVTVQIVCYTNEDDFYKRKNGTFFEDKLEEEQC